MFNGPIENADLRVISLGAGVQSTVMALKAAKGEIKPMPDAAIFADTGWEPENVYEHLQWLKSELPFPVYITTGYYGNIRETSLASTKENSKWTPSIPVYIASDRPGLGSRSCTNQYKIQPIQKKIRELLGLKPRQHMPKGTVVENWLGISLDEIFRAKDSREDFIVNRHPLIEQKITRYICQNWFAEKYQKRPLTKSACIGCPYHTNAQWREMKVNDKTSWDDAVDFDKKLRSGYQNAFHATSPIYLHKSMKPLDEVDFANETDKGQLDMFGEECEGMCGV